jgi:hypothetical protein
MIKLKTIIESLNEAPIGDYEFRNVGPADSFSKKDIDLISNPINIKKIRDFFDKVDTKFNFYFINSKTPEISDFIERFSYGRTSKDELKSKYNINIPEPKSDEITVVFVSNYGTNLVALTPWIIAHRISHVLTIEPHISKIYSKIFRLIETTLSSIFYWNYSYVNAESTDDDDTMVWLFHSYKDEIVNQLYSKLFTFKTAREKNLQQTNEYIHELFAQFIKSGTVEIKIPSEFNFVGKPFRARDDFSSEDIRNEEISLIRNVDALLNSMLLQAQGDIYII